MREHEEHERERRQTDRGDREPLVVTEPSSVCPSATSPPSIEGTLEGGADSRRRAGSVRHGLSSARWRDPRLAGDARDALPRRPSRASPRRGRRAQARVGAAALRSTSRRSRRSSSTGRTTLVADARGTRGRDGARRARARGLGRRRAGSRSRSPRRHSRSVDESLAVLTDRAPSGIRCAGRSIASCSSWPRRPCRPDPRRAGDPAPEGTTYRAWLVAPAAPHRGGRGGVRRLRARRAARAPGRERSTGRGHARAGRRVPDARRGRFGSLRFAAADGVGFSRHGPAPGGCRPEPDTRQSAASVA